MTKITKKTRLHKVTHQLAIRNSIDLTRPEIQHNIQDHGVYVNGTLVYNRLFWVNQHDHLDFSHWPKRTHGDFSGIKVVKESEYFYIFFKPAGVVVEPGNGHQNDNFMTWFLDKYPQQHSLGEDSKFGLVHRLDKDTQGLLLVAKTLQSYNYYKSLFKEHKITKKYLTILRGKLNFNIDVVTYNVRDRDNPTRQKSFILEKDAKLYDSKYRNAHSNFCPLLYCDSLDQTLVEVTLKTGRMHQIRLQAETLGHSLVNDTKYNKTLVPDYSQFVIHSSESKGMSESKIEHDFKNVLDSDETKFLAIKKELFNSVSFDLLANSLEFVDFNNNKYLVEYKNVKLLLSSSIQSI